MDTPYAIHGQEVMEDRLRNIRLVIMDVDGVLTDGSIILDNKGGELKIFNVKDGHGIVLLHRVGIKTALISGRKSKVVRIRAQELKVPFVFQGVKDKLEIYERLKNEEGLKDEEIAFIGDDLMDLPVLSRVGVAVAVADAHPMVKKAAHIITTSAGGKGAIREFAEALLKAQGKWEKATERYLR